MTKFVFYKLNEHMLATMNLPPLPFPVRKKREERIFGHHRIALDLVLEELELFLREHPEYEERYRNALGLLSYLVGVELGTEGKTERAIRCFELGLAHNPDNLSLRANYAISLHALGRVDEALDQYEGMIRDPDIGVSPHIWVLAARLYDKQGNYARAHELMKACEPLLPPEDRARKFLAELKTKVAKPRAESTPRRLREAASGAEKCRIKPRPREADGKKIASRYHFPGKAKNWWLGLSVFTVIEIVTVFIVNFNIRWYLPSLDNLYAFFPLHPILDLRPDYLNALFVIPAFTVIFSMFSPVRWNLALFYVLLFHIGSMTGHMLGGFGWSVAEMVARYGIAIMNALICAAIVKRRLGGEGASWHSETEGVRWQGVAKNPSTLRLLAPTTGILLVSGLAFAMTYVYRLGWTMADWDAQERFVKPQMIVVSAGQFKMGCVSGKKCSDVELPVRTVTFNEPFAIGKYEVTFAEYDLFAERTGRKKPYAIHWWRGRHPVVNVSWRDAAAYAKWLSEQTGKHYRLPSEAEWEYATRGGTTTLFSTGECINTDQANYFGEADWGDCPKTGVFRGRTLEVGSLPANPWGLHEVHGNVSEWVEDCWHDSYRGAPKDGSPWREGGGGSCLLHVVRGGGWHDIPGVLGSARRDVYLTDERSSSVGFRLAQDRVTP